MLPEDFLAEYIANEEALGEIAKKIVAFDRPKIFLHGEMGVGKTTLARHIFAEWTKEPFLGSPTYPIAHHYQNCTHIDLYRIADETELFESGLIDPLTQKNFRVVVEWPDLALQLGAFQSLRDQILRIYMDVTPSGNRRFKLLLTL